MLFSNLTLIVNKELKLLNVRKRGDGFRFEFSNWENITHAGHVELADSNPHSMSSSQIAIKKTHIDASRA